MPQMNRRSHRRLRGFSLIELLIVIAIILVIAAIAVPKYNQVQMNAREMAVIREVTAVHQAQTQYYSQFGKFAENLAQLGPAAGGQAASPAAADILSASLAGGEKNGYRYTVQVTKEGYSVTAIPLAYGNTGRRTFFSDQSMVIRHNWSAEPATAQSPEISATAATTTSK
jgi:type IV pilus assembly protein PilA